MCLSERTGHGASACRQWIIEAAARDIMQDRIKACLAILGILDQHLFFLKGQAARKGRQSLPQLRVGWKTEGNFTRPGFDVDATALLQQALLTSKSLPAASRNCAC